MKTAALSAVKYTAAAVDTVRPRHRGVTVLIYHRVGGRSGLQVDLGERLFEAQMELLAAGERAVTIDDALNVLVSSDPPAVDPVVVTFDDGTTDWIDTVMPILVRHRVPATFYVATDFVERQVPFPNDGVPISWAGLRDMVSTGLVTVGSHTHTHALLDRLPTDRVFDELNRSGDLLENRLGAVAAHFAYPKALLGSAEATAAVKQRFRSAALAGTRPNPYGRTDPYRLARSPIQVADGLRWFRRKALGGMQLEDIARRFLNRRRYADSTS